MTGKENKDERIQKLLDQGSLEVYNEAPEMIDDADVEAYNALYDALKQKPAQGLSYSFKSSVMKRIELEKKQADDTKFYVLFGLVFLLGIVAVTTMFFMLKDQLTPFLTVFDKFKGYIIIGIVTLILSNLADQKLIKGRR